jgi:signal transduction histidine kinase
MNEAVRRRIPWLIATFIMASLVPALLLVAANGTRLSDVPSSVLMVVGYSTVGALLASRTPRNPIGWLMMMAGASFLVLGFTDEYLIYTFETNPGALPLGEVAALLNSVLWIPMMFGILLLLTLFPTGRVTSRRWRFLPSAIVLVGAIAFLGSTLRPGPFEQLPLEATITNPLGVEALRSTIEAVFSGWWLGYAAAALLAIASPVVRYRRAVGEERQQIRWLAYITATVIAVVLIWVLASIAGVSREGSAVDDAFWIAVLSLVGVGVPTAIGVAVLKYRLYDLDLVVKKTVLYATLAVSLTAVFLVVALGIGTLAGRSSTGAVVAAGVIGLLFWPALRLARRVADRVVYGRRASPYEVLTEFSARVGGSYGDEDVLPRMAQILADAVNASTATVWLRVGNELRPAAISPTGEVPRSVPLPGDRLPLLEADSAVEVRDRGELLGALAVSVPPNDPITPAKERLVRDLASQAGLVLRNVRLIEELRASRQRLVAAQDEERRRLERNIHDRAQQQLVALSVKLRLARSLVAKDQSKAEAMLDELQAQTSDTLEDLRDLARGIYPPLLADRGLGAALEAQARKAPAPTRVTTDGIGRYAQDVEAGVYFCVLEALQNVTKYASATAVDLNLRNDDGHLIFEVHDDGVGFDPSTAPRGTGLQGMADRLDAVGGKLEVDSAPGRGTSVRGRVPARGRPSG